MMEKNVFRSMMLVGSILTLGIIIGSFFYAPAIKVDNTTNRNYTMVMGHEATENRHHDDSLTLYETLMFSIEGKSRARVRHY